MYQQVQLVFKGLRFSNQELDENFNCEWRNAKHIQVLKEKVCGKYKMKSVPRDGNDFVAIDTDYIINDVDKEDIGKVWEEISAKFDIFTEYMIVSIF